MNILFWDVRPPRKLPISEKRLQELRQLQRRRALRISDFRSQNEFECFYFPKEYEQEMLADMSSGEQAVYLGIKAAKEAVDEAFKRMRREMRL